MLKQNNIHLKNVYLFGSYAKGNFTEWSDIDLALVSEYFEGIRFYDRDKIRILILSISSHLEILPFNPRDFSVENPFAREVIETGIQLI
ncbi:MAG: nucleotidyltransferase domain-containing protein [bacterium]